MYHRLNYPLSPAAASLTAKHLGIRGRLAQQPISQITLGTTPDASQFAQFSPIIFLRCVPPPTLAQSRTNFVRKRDKPPNAEAGIETKS